MLQSICNINIYINYIIIYELMFNRWMLVFCIAINVFKFFMCKEIYIYIYKLFFSYSSSTTCESWATCSICTIQNKGVLDFGSCEGCYGSKL